MASPRSAQFSARPLFMQALAGDPEINYTAKEFGELLVGMWPYPGVLTPTSFHVEQADTLGWNIKIRPGRAAIYHYYVWNFSEITIDVSVLNTNPVGTRTHRVWLVVNDREEGGTEYAARVVVTEDFGSGAPEPTDATGILLLGTFTISPGQTGVLSQHIVSRPRNASIAGEFTDIKAEGFLNNTVNEIRSVNSAAAPPRARYGAGRVQLSGAIMRALSPATSFTAADNPMAIGTLPFYLRPQYDVYLTLASSHFKPWKLHIEPDGDMYALIPDDSAPLYLYFDGATYEVD